MSNQNDRHEHTLELKRLAFQLVSQLPADPHDAAEVLHYCLDLIENFYGKDQPGSPVGADIVRLVKG